MRGLTIDIDVLLMDLDSGPVQEASQDSYFSYSQDSYFS